MRTMLMMMVAMTTMTACSGDGSDGDDSSPDPRAVACTVFSDDHAGYLFHGASCTFTTDDLEPVLEFDGTPWIEGGWDPDPNGPGDATTQTTQVAADTWKTGGMTWTGDGGAHGVAIGVQPIAPGGVPQWCVWKRCL